MAKNQKSYTPEFKQQLVDLYNAYQNFEESKKGTAPAAFTVRTALPSELLQGSGRKEQSIL